MMIILSVFGWGPYLISWLYSRKLLDGRIKAVNAFSLGAILVTLLGVALYQNLFSLPDKLPSVLISTGVTLSLIALAKVSSLLWGSE